jgi:hypothetical protein
MRRFAGPGLLAAAVALSCGGKTLDCGQLPCPDQLLITGDLSYKGTEAVNLDVKFCRNAQCGQANVQAQPLGRAEVTLQGDLLAVVVLASRGANDTWQLSVKLNDDAGADGDVVSLRLTTVPGGTVIHDRTSSPLKFQTVQPNGPECKPTCRWTSATFPEN